MDQNELDQYNPVKQFIDTPAQQAGPQPAQANAEQFINVRDPDTLEIGSIPASQLQEATAQGFQPVSHDEAKSYVHEQKYGSTSQQTITALEGAGVGATFGLSTLAERALGVDPEDIRARAETNPGAHGLGQVGGIAASMLIPVYGEANALEAAGTAAASKIIPAAAEAFSAAKALQAAKVAGVGVEEAIAAAKAAKAAQPFLVKVGAEGANQLVQGAMIGGGNELSKMFASDPNQTVQTAITDIGLSGLLGGVAGAGIGAVSPLWQATAGNKLEGFLNKFKNRINGDSIPIGNEFETVLKNAAPEVRAGLSQDPMAQRFYQELIESGTPSGEALRATRDNFVNEAKEQLGSVFKSAEGTTAFEAGNAAKESILNKADEMHSAIKEKYNAIGDTNTIAIPDEARLKQYDTIIEQGQNFGSAGNPNRELFKNYGERLLAQDTVGQIDELVSEIGTDASIAKRAGDFKKADALNQIKHSVRDFQEKEIENSFSRLAKETGDPSVKEMGTQLLQQKNEARKAYQEFITTLGDIASVGKMGKARSYGQFQEALEKIPAAKLADKLFDKKNIEGLNYLKSTFPDVFESLVQQKKADILEAAMKTGELSHNKLLNSVNSLPQEVRSLMFRPEELSSIENSAKIISEAKVRINPSGTARTQDALWKHMPAGVGAAASWLTGHNPIVGAVLGELATKIGRDAPDAIKLSLLKFLGTSGPVDSGAFKAAVEYADKAIRAQKMVTNAAKGVFAPGAEIGGKSFIPSQSEREKLDKKLKDLQKDPDKLFEVAGKAGYYLPDHGTAASQTSMNAVNYLNAQRPQNPKLAPLDKDMPITFQQKAAYDRTLNIAQQPLFVMNHIKEGTILPQDVNTLKALYPDLYTKLSQDLTNNMIEAVEKEKPIPYKTRQGLTLFLGQPMDSTFLPMSIQAAQGVFMQQKQNNAALAQQAAPKGNTDKLDKLSKSFQTSGQASQERRLQDY